MFIQDNVLFQPQNFRLIQEVKKGKNYCFNKARFTFGFEGYIYWRTRDFWIVRHWRYGIMERMIAYRLNYFLFEVVFEFPQKYIFFKKMSLKMPAMMIIFFAPGLTGNIPPFHALNNSNEKNKWYNE